MGPSEQYTSYIHTMASIQRLNTTYTKDNHNPVQMDVEKLFLYKSLKKKHSTGSLHSHLSSSDNLQGLSAASLKRRKSAQLELKMREKTAHNGRRAYYSNNRADDANNANTASRLSGVVSSWLF